MKRTPKQRCSYCGVNKIGNQGTGIWTCDECQRVALWTPRSQYPKVEVVGSSEPIRRLGDEDR